MSNRRPRPSLTSPPPTSSTSSTFPSSHHPPGADDISHLTLPEVQERLARNSRVLNTGLFASPPISTNNTSTIPTPPTIGNGNGRIIQGVGRTTQTTYSAGNSPTDTVRDRLMVVRRQLLEREKELMLERAAEGMGGLQLNGAVETQHQPTQQVLQVKAVNGGHTSDNGVRNRAVSEDPSDEGEGSKAESSAMAGRRRSGPAPAMSSGMGPKGSGKRVAMMHIQEREKGYAPNGLMLPVSESIALASRDFDINTASRLSALSLGPHAHGLDMGGIPRSSSSPKSRRHRTLGYPDESPLSNPIRGGEDENARAQALARVNAFMSYKSGRYDDDDEDDEDDGGGGRYDGPEGDGIDGMFDFEEPDYPESSALDGRRRGEDKGKRRERGTGEEVDRFGEDDEGLAEGNGDGEDEDGEGMEM